MYLQKLINSLKQSENERNAKKFIPDPEHPLPPSASQLHQFKNGAVCSDAEECSKIGRFVRSNPFNFKHSEIYLNLIVIILIRSASATYSNWVEIFSMQQSPHYFVMESQQRKVWALAVDLL